MIGILLVNLGTPDAPTVPAVRRYLAEFLWDRRVVELPRALWWLILNGIVLRIRPKRSAKLYQKVWIEEGSPLLVYSQRLAQKLQINLQEKLNQPVIVALGMRYGNPSIAQALEQLRQQNLQQIIILPLYPQYSASTTGSSFDAVAKVLQTWRYVPRLHFIQQYFNDPDYITAIADDIRAHAQLHGTDKHLLFSFHGLPQSFVASGDPYQQQCLTSAELIAEQLQLPPEHWTVAFQSRFGYAEWLQPYCDATLKTLPQEGKKQVTVVCPGFAVDCLETLEEINQLNRELFLQAGGEDFHYVPGLNDSDKHVALLAQLATKNL